MPSQAHAFFTRVVDRCGNGVSYKTSTEAISSILAVLEVCSDPARPAPAPRAKRLGFRHIRGLSSAARRARGTGAALHEVVVAARAAAADSDSSKPAGGRLVRDANSTDRPAPTRGLGRLCL